MVTNASEPERSSLPSSSLLPARHSRESHKQERKEDLEENQPQSPSALPTKQKREENMEEELHSICSTSRDLSATCWLLCFRGVCFGMFLPTTRPELPPSFLYSSLPLEIQILLRTGLSVLPLPPSLLHTGMERNITALYNRCFFFLLLRVFSLSDLFSLEAECYKKDLPKHCAATAVYHFWF